MKPITLEWIAKAEGDWDTACRELHALPSPNLDAACFHAQQCAEKYLKARLVEADVAFPKTHDLGALLSLASPLQPHWEELRTDLDALTDLAIEVRYPGTFVDEEDAQHAVERARRVRTIVRDGLGLPP